MPGPPTDATAVPRATPERSHDPDGRADGRADHGRDGGSGPPSGGRVAAAVRLAGITSAVAWILVAMAWPEGPFALTYDDAYYYLEIARRFAAGEGSTFDGLNSTNGYHPLWMLLCSVPYLLAITGTMALRLVLALQGVLWAASWWIVGGLVGRAAGAWPRLGTAGRRGDAGVVVATVGGAALLLACSPTIARIAVSGLESGLVLLLGVAVLARAWKGGGRLVEGRSLRWRFGFGALLALAVLSRTDHLLLVGAVALAIAFEPRRGRSVGDQLRSAVPVLAVPAVVALAYLASNQVIFGTWLQISGEIKRRPLSPALALVGFAVAVLVVVVIRAGARAAGRTDAADPPGGRLGRTRSFAAGTAWYGAFCLALTVYYTVFQVQQWLWYFAPLLAWGGVLLLLFVLDLFESAVVEAPPDQGARRATAPLHLLLGIPLVVGFVLQWREFTDPEIRSVQLANKRAAEWISEELPPDAVLASWDAGILGYYADQPVVNIDGVVNSAEWHEATREGPGAVRAFLDADGVGYVVNHGVIVDGEDPSIVDYVSLVFGPERAAAMELVERFPFTYSGGTVGSSGRATGRRQFAVFVYRVPPPGP